MDPDLICSSGLDTNSDNSKKHKTKNLDYLKEMFPNLIPRACAFLLDGDQWIAASWNERDFRSTPSTQHRRNLQPQQSLVRFVNVFRRHDNEKPAFSDFPVPRAFPKSTVFVTD